MLTDQHVPVLWYSCPRFAVHMRGLAWKKTNLRIDNAPKAGSWNLYAFGVTRSRFLHRNRVGSVLCAQPGQQARFVGVRDATSADCLNHLRIYLRLSSHGEKAKTTSLYHRGPRYDSDLGNIRNRNHPECT